jgi:hypothetical protein
MESVNGTGFQAPEPVVPGADSHLTDSGRSVAIEVKNAILSQKAALGEFDPMPLGGVSGERVKSSGWGGAETKEASAPAPDDSAQGNPGPVEVGTTIRAGDTPREKATAASVIVTMVSGFHREREPPHIGVRKGLPSRIPKRHGQHQGADERGPAVEATGHLPNALTSPKSLIPFGLGGGERGLGGEAAIMDTQELECVRALMWCGNKWTESETPRGGIGENFSLGRVFGEAKGPIDRSTDVQSVDNGLRGSGARGPKSAVVQIHAEANARAGSDAVNPASHNTGKKEGAGRASLK